MKNVYKWCLCLVVVSLTVQCGSVKYASNGGTIAKVENIASYDKIDTSIINDKRMLEFLAPYKIKLDQAMDSIVGQSKLPLTKAQPESTLGNLVADAQLWAINQSSAAIPVYISITNQGGIRIPYVASGNITLGKVFEIMPFDNKLVVVDVPADTLIRWCHHIAERGGWPVSGITFTIQDKKATNIQVRNQNLHSNQIYQVVTSDYIANGGDNCDFLKGLKRKSYNILLRDAMASYIKANSAIKPLEITIENRIQYAE